MQPTHPNAGNQGHITVHPRFDRARAETLIAKTAIRGDSKVMELSKGMIVQLHLALIMAIDAKLLVLDEPTLGLDLPFRKQFYGAFTAPGTFPMDPMTHPSLDRFLVSPGVWTGLAMTALFLAAAIRLRHYREPL